HAVTEGVDVLVMDDAVRQPADARNSPDRLRLGETRGDDADAHEAEEMAAADHPVAWSSTPQRRNRLRVHGWMKRSGLEIDDGAVHLRPAIAVVAPELTQLGEHAEIHVGDRYVALGVAGLGQDLAAG